MLRTIDDLQTLLKRQKKHKIVVVFAHDEYVIEAIAEAMKLDIIEPILIGDKAIIDSLCQKYHISASVIEEMNPNLATKIAMDLVNENQADIVMKGLIDTKYLLKGVVSNDYGIKNKPLLSHVGIVGVPGMDRVLFASDGAMMISPTVEEKIAIIENAVELALNLGYIMPKVGIVSSVEKVNPKIPSTVDAENIVNHYKDKNIPFIIDGPFAVDNLVSYESTIHKNIQSEVAGRADILIFPNLDGGNIFYKTSVFLAKGDSAGLVIGAKVPIIVTSRADTMKTKFNSILLAVVNQDGLLTINH